jgi:hypothetical protein
LRNRNRERAIEREKEKKEKEKKKKRKRKRERAEEVVERKGEKKVRKDLCSKYACCENTD